ncbi:copper resistance system multicopper oxidase [Rubrivirga litoralis]|uniref:Copper resistance system multicopper oxidase n=1 Tax=Rubrivirga litoralis TaxID=3075598 RepID=A0ABU3BNA6_9BACT|nr:copper resistance system multicopper oxidase [Rubrivirga sp. F394]MDT0630758.1 copper resistance system multicopper oxidase [Rubrivirga sp. F394]
MDRRLFLRNASAVGALAGLSALTPAWARPALAAGPARAAGLAPTRRAGGLVEYDLTIDRTPVTFNGRTGSAVTMNGSVPGPLLRFTEGDEAVIRVHNRLDEQTSVHWHGLILPNAMDGVPKVNFPGIEARSTFEYRFPIRQFGTYWCHSHSAFQEQQGHYAPLVIDPAGPEPYAFDRELIVVLSDWTFEDPHDVLATLKKRANYYNFQRQTVAGLVAGEGMDPGARLDWDRMRMDPTDIADITGATYTFLMNGQAPDPGWSGQFRPGERVRLRFINASAGTFYDVRIPGLDLTVVQVSGQHVQPVTVEEFRMGIAETYDVVVTPGDRAYTVFAESMDRSGYARGTLAPRPGMTAPVPERRERPSLTMMDMGMDHGSMGGMDHGAMGHEGAAAGGAGGAAHAGMDHGAAGHGAMAMGGAAMGGAAAGAVAAGDVAEPGVDRTGLRPPGTLPEVTPHGPDDHGGANAMAPDQTRSRLHEPGVGLGDDGRRVLVYTDLRALYPEPRRAPDREVELHLTGNMERYMWGINGKTYAEEPLIPMVYGERLRLTMVNDTMMNHPMHLHGMWMELENGHGDVIPRVHTVVVKPAERLSLLIDVDALGPWAFHCHILYHMDLGMFRVAMVQRPGEVPPEALAASYTPQG